MRRSVFAAAAVIALTATTAAVIPGTFTVAIAAAPAASDPLAGLVIAPEKAAAPYSRTMYRHWIASGAAGCDVRDRVLIRDATVRPKVYSGCRLVGGTWTSLYDKKTFTTPSSLDVDHVVPLAEAHRSGGWKWSAQRRQAYANDLKGLTLLAVSASSNRSKGDRDPAEWLPPNKAYRCDYAARWVSVKKAWKLTVDKAEATALRRVLRGCTGTRVTTAPAPTTAAPTWTVTATAPTAATTATAAPSAPVPATTTPTIPAPEPTVTTTTATSTDTGPAPRRYATCADARAAGVTPIYAGTPLYDLNTHLDRDHDGIACE